MPLLCLNLFELSQSDFQIETSREPFFVAVVGRNVAASCVYSN